MSSDLLIKDELGLDRVVALDWSRKLLREAKGVRQVVEVVLDLTCFEFGVFLGHLMEVKGVSMRRLSILSKCSMREIRIHLTSKHKGRTPNYYLRDWIRLTVALLQSLKKEVI